MNKKKHANNQYGIQCTKNTFMIRNLEIKEDKPNNKETFKMEINHLIQIEDNLNNLLQHLKNQLKKIMKMME